MKILVTGGTGFIGSHTCVELINQGYHPVILDNLSNSSTDILKKITEITKMDAIPFFEGDIRDEMVLKKIFKTHQIKSVIHFAGLKSVEESIQNPIKYYNNNVSGTINLLKEMCRADVKTIIFSSSATVYGAPKILPIKESHSIGKISNPYGRSKLIIEDILKDLQHSDSSWKVALLRYFNPVGAHSSGKIGESSIGVPSNLMPYITQVATGKLNKLKVYGDDYSTPDGTGIRDYIHIEDLAKGHIAALKKIVSDESNLLTINLGTGTGYSVLEVVKAFEKASGKKIPYEIVARRDGDMAECYASTKYAEQCLNWKAKYSLQKMCADSWNFSNT